MKRWYPTAYLCLTLATAFLSASCSGERGDAAETGAASGAAETTQGQAALSAQARVDSTTAQQAALAAVPGGTIVKSELEKEKGSLFWSFDIKVQGEDGIDEVHVDALTGKVIKTEHESAEEEAAESGDGH